MGHKNKKSVLGKIRSLFLVGILVVPIVGNMLVEMDVWADEPTKSVCKTAVLTPDKDGETIYGIQVCADEYASGAVNVTKIVGLKDYSNGGGTTVSEIKIGKVTIKTQRDFETSDRYTNAWVDFGANGAGTNGSPDDHDDDGVDNNSNSSFISNGHTFNGASYNGAEKFVDRVMEHVVYWSKKWEQDLKITGGMTGGEEKGSANCSSSAITPECRDDATPSDVLSDEEERRVDISTCYIKDGEPTVVPNMSGGASSSTWTRYVYCNGTKVPDIKYSIKDASGKDNVVTESDAIAQSASDNADDPTSSGSGDAGGSTAGSGSTSGGSDATATKPDCYKNVGALAWIVCTVLDAAGNMLQWVYENVVTPMMKIDSSMLDREGAGKATYEAWGKFQGFANIIFVIFMLVVIISQVTGIGISNLGIKRVLPRLIVAVLLINLSYLICSIAVDISNMLGVSANELLKGMGGDVNFSVMAEGDTYATADKVDIAITVGGIETVAGVIGGSAVAIAALGGLGLVITILLALVSAIISTLVFFLLLAARQAIVIVLIVISPVAVVLYTLPNTQNYFNKYTHLFSMTLMLYPICGAIMGAGEFASRLYLNVVAVSMEDGSWVSVLNTCVGMLIDVLPFLAIPGLTRKALDGVAGIGTKAMNWGNRSGRQLSGAIRNAESVQRALENSRLGIKNNGELSRTGKFRQAWGKSGLLGSKTNARRTQRALGAARQRSEENADLRNFDENGDKLFEAARNAGTIQSEARMHDMIKMADNEYARMQGRQQMDAADAREATLRALYAQDAEFGGEKDLHKAQINDAAVRGMNQAKRMGLWENDAYAGRKLTEMDEAIMAENIKTETAGMLNDARWLKGEDKQKELIREKMLEAKETDNVALTRAIGNIVDKGHMNAFRGELNAATGDEDSELYQALHDENGELTAEGRLFMQNLALAGQGNGVLMSDNRMAAFMTKSSLVGGTLSENFADYQFGAKKDGEATAESRAVAEISPDDFRTMDKGFLHDYANAVATGELELKTGQQQALTNYTKTNSYKSLDAERKGIVDGAISSSGMYANGSISYKDDNSGATRTAHVGNLDEMAEASRVGNLSSAQRTAIDGAILGAVTENVSKISLSSASSFSAENQDQAIKVASEGLGKVSATRFGEMMGNSDTAAANQVINRAVSGAGNGTMTGVSSTRKEQMASRVSNQIMSSGSPASSPMLGSVARNLTSDNSEARGMGAMVTAKMMGSNNFSTAFGQEDRSAMAGWVGQNLGSIASSDRGRILGSEMVTNGGSITTNGEVVRAATGSAATLNALSSEIKTQVASKVAEGGLASQLSSAQFANVAKASGLEGATRQAVIEAGSETQINSMVDSWNASNFTATTEDRQVAQILATSPKGWDNTDVGKQNIVLRTAQIDGAQAETVRAQVAEQQRVEEERITRLDELVANNSGPGQLRNEVNRLVSEGNMADASYVISQEPTVLADFNTPGGAEAIQRVASSSAESAKAITEALAGLGRHSDTKEITKKLVSDQEVYSLIKDSDTKKKLTAMSGMSENIAKEERDATARITQAAERDIAKQQAQTSPTQTVTEDIRKAGERNTTAQTAAQQLQGQAATGPGTGAGPVGNETFAQTLMQYGPRVYGAPPPGGPGGPGPGPGPGGPRSGGPGPGPAP